MASTNTPRSKPTLLRLRRIKEGLTLDDVAERTGINRSDLSRYERTQGRAFNDQKEATLADLFSITVERLRKEAGYSRRVVWDIHPKATQEVA